MATLGDLSTDISTVKRNPQALASGMLPDPYELPDSDAASLGLRSLQTSARGGFEDLTGMVGQGAEARNKPYEDALYARSAETINREADDLSRAINETTFGRNVGFGTIRMDEQDRLTRQRLDSLGRARRDAYIGAGAEARNDVTASLAALNAAFSAGSSGLRDEANVGMTNTAREQQARTTGTQSALAELTAELLREQQGGQFTRGLEQQKGLQEASFENASDIARNQMLAQGITAGLGGLGSLFGPAIRNAVNPALQTWLEELLKSSTAQINLDDFADMMTG